SPVPNRRRVPSMSSTVNVPSNTYRYAGTGCVIHDVTPPGGTVTTFDETTGSGGFGYARDSPAMVFVSEGSAVMVASVELDCAGAVATTRPPAVNATSAPTHLRNTLRLIANLQASRLSATVRRRRESMSQASYPARV